MAGTVVLEVVTPSRRLITTEAEIVIVPTQDGSLGVLWNHAPLVATLGIGMMQYGVKFGAKKRIAVSGGFVEIADNKVTVLADVAELAEEIDVLRAVAAKERAERRLRIYSTKVDFYRASMALRRALNRLRVARYTDKDE